MLGLKQGPLVAVLRLVPKEPRGKEEVFHQNTEPLSS